MPNYRRLFVPNATYFLTVVTYDRRPILTEATARAILHESIENCQADFPFDLQAIVLLPEHFHMLIKLPEGNVAYPARLGFIKKEFTKKYLSFGGEEAEITMNQRLSRRRGIWQPRYWEHTIENEDDYENHFHYIHYNPVKHGLVSRVRDWPYSSFHRWVKEGIYPERWACGPQLQTSFDTIAKKAGE